MSDFVKHIDTDYSLYVIEELRKFGSNPDLGFRTSGSEAEKKAADFILSEYEKIGLVNCRKEKVTVDTFEFKRADIRFQSADGEEKKALLSSFQTTCCANDEEIEIIYIGKGRDVDYEGIDAEGKYVLVDIDMIEDWWVNWPLCQARTKKAKGIIVVNVGGYCSYSEECIGTQDVYGPADTPAFSMSVKDANVLKAAIKANGGSVRAVLNADAKVEKDGYSYCVIGEIPGEIDEVVYVIGHYDAYFRAFDDNTAGIGCMLGIVKAFLDSGYKPNRTLRVICHSSEEWGLENSKYDWARGAWMLTQNHPEWSDNGFLLVNLDGNTINSTATAVQVRTCYEMAPAIVEMGKTIEGKAHEIETNQPIWTWTESIMYNYMGIPTIETFYKDVDFWGFYHSTHDTKEIHCYTDEEFRSSHTIYGSYLQMFDKMKVRPLDFTESFTRLRDSAENCGASKKAAFVELSSKAVDAAVKINAIDTDAMDADEVKTFNQKVSALFKKINLELYGINWYEEFDFAHMRYFNNINSLEAAIKKLNNGNVTGALDEDLRNVDLTWYMYHFDKETCDFLTKQVLEPSVVTWGTGIVETEAGLWDVVRSLMKKQADGNAEVSDEIAVLNGKLEEQKSLLDKKVEKVITSLEVIVGMMEELA